MPSHTRERFLLSTGKLMEASKMFLFVMLLLVSSVAVSLVSSACVEHNAEVHCSCNPNNPLESPGLFVTFKAFENVSNVTVTDCHNVTFVGDVYLLSPPSNIRFINIKNLYHQLETHQLSTSNVMQAPPIERIEFVNVSKIFQLHLNELFPVNRVELLLLKNVTEVLTMECLPQTITKPDIVPSRITEVRIENTRIMNLRPYSFNLIHNRKFIVRNAYIFTWSSKAIDVGPDNRLFSVVNTVVSTLHAEPITGSVVEEAEIKDSKIGNALNNAFSAFSFTKNVRITGNEIRKGHYKTFDGLFRWTSNRTVDFSGNALPCPLISAPGRLCLVNVNANTRVFNNTCFSMVGINWNSTFDRHYDIRCQSASTSTIVSPHCYVIMVSLLFIFRKKS